MRGFSQSTEDLPDDDLVLRYQQGQSEAFDQLFDRHCMSVYNFASSMLGDTALAEDVMQETFMAVARTAATYTPCGYFRGWVMRIVRNRCLNRLDAERLRRCAMGSDGLDIVEPVAADPPPYSSVQTTEQAAIVARAIAGLPDRQREAIVLYAVEQMSYARIADVLDTPINTVKTLIHRARAGIAQALEAQEGS